MLARVVIENGVKKLAPLTADCGSGNPCGAIITVYQRTVPNGYLPLGAQYDITQFPVLYSILGTDTIPTASALGLPTLTTGQYVIKATSGINENQADNVLSALTPVDTVASGNMHSVTSNAVAGAVTGNTPYNPFFNNYNSTFNIDTVGAGHSTYISTAVGGNTTGTCPSNYGVVETIVGNNGEWKFQIAKETYSDTTYTRQNINNYGWTTWEKVVKKSDIGSYNTDGSEWLTNDQRIVIMQSFNDVADYSPFEGSTLTGREGRWIGYRNAGYGLALYMTRSVILGIYISNNAIQKTTIIMDVSL